MPDPDDPDDSAARPEARADDPLPARREHERDDWLAPTPAPSTAGDVPAGTPTPAPAEPPALPRTISWWLSGPAIDGIGAVDTATAHRLLCTARYAIATFAPNGEILHLGRAQRLASRAQRRALTARDRACQFPGCTRARSLEAHHITWWSRGGDTNIDQLILLCRFHHVLTHAADLTITRLPAGGWRFTRIGGEHITPEHQNPTEADRRRITSSGAATHRPQPDQRLIATLLTDLLGPLHGIYRTDHPSAAAMFLTWGGERGSGAAEILFYAQALKQHRAHEAQPEPDPQPDPAPQAERDTAPAATALPT